eukprot:Colp12_sorted_trinity150504_noHs@15051
MENSLCGIESQEENSITNGDIDYARERFKELEQALLLAFKEPSVAKSLGSFAPKLILLHGPSGVGKLESLHVLAKFHQIHYHRVNVSGDWSIELEKGFAKGLRTQPSVIVVEKANLIFTHSEQGEVRVEKLLSLLRRLRNEVAVAVVLVADTKDGIHSGLISHCDTNIFVDLPRRNHIALLLRKLLPTVPLANGVAFDSILDFCNGLVERDVKYLFSLSFQHAFSQWMGTHVGEPLISIEDLEFASKSLRRHLKLSAQPAKPVHWSDIGGLEDVKLALEEAVIWIYRHSEAYQRLGIQPSNGILLYGPPGTGKTLLARAVATEAQVNFMPVNVADLMSSEVGQSEKLLAEIFEKAKEASPCVVFIDELQALFGHREGASALGAKLISQFVLSLDSLSATAPTPLKNSIGGFKDTPADPPSSLEKIETRGGNGEDKGVNDSRGGLSEARGVVVMAATNIPDAIDPCLLTPGRFDRLIYVGPPDAPARAD